MMCLARPVLKAGICETRGCVSSPLDLKGSLGCAAPPSDPGGGKRLRGMIHYRVVCRRTAASVALSWWIGLVEGG